MCLSTVYMDSGNEQKEIMKDVAQIEAEGQDFWFINLFGERKFIEGSVWKSGLPRNMNRFQLLVWSAETGLYGD